MTQNENINVLRRQAQHCPRCEKHAREAVQLLNALAAFDAALAYACEKHLSESAAAEVLAFVNGYGGGEDYRKVVL